MHTSHQLFGEKEKVKLHFLKIVNNGPFPASFLFSSFEQSTANNFCVQKLLMAGPSGVENNHSANYDIITVLFNKMLMKSCFNFQSANVTYLQVFSASIYHSDSVQNVFLSFLYILSSEHFSVKQIPLNQIRRPFRDVQLIHSAWV